MVFISRSPVSASREQAGVFSSKMLQRLAQDQIDFCLEFYRSPRMRDDAMHDLLQPDWNASSNFIQAYRFLFTRREQHAKLFLGIP